MTMRRVLSLFLALGMVLTLCGCGKKPSGGSQTPNLSLSYPDYEASESYEAAQDAASYTGKEEWPETVWHLTCDGGTNSSQAAAGRYFNALMQHSTGGKVQVEVHPASSLAGGDPEAAVQQLMYGDEVQLSLQSALSYAQFDPRLSVTALPFLFPSNEMAAETLSGRAGKQLKEVLDLYGMVCLGIGENGFLQLVNDKRPVAQAADLEGLSVSVPEERLLAYQLGRLCSASAGSLTESIQSFRSRESDGMTAALPDLEADWAGKRYVTLWNEAYDPVFLCINQNVYSQFSEDQKKVISSNAAKAVSYQKAIQRRHSSERLEKYRQDDTVSVTSYEEVDTDSFRELLAGVESWYERTLMTEVGLSQEEAQSFIAYFHIE